MSYDAEIDADGPLGFWLHDETPAASNGDMLEDRSGNARDLTLCFNGAGGLEPYGQPSPIETYSNSRALHTYSDNTSHVGGDYAYAWNTASAFNLARDFTLECWAKSRSDVVAGTFYPFFGKRGRFRLARTFGGAGGGAANFYFTLRVTLTDGITYVCVAETPVYNGVAYYLSAGRLGNSLFIRLNKQLAGQLEIPDLDIASPSSGNLSLTPCTPPGDSLIVGGLPFNDVHNDVDLAKCALYDYALGVARANAHYDAARLTQAVSGAARGGSTATLDSFVVPDPAPFVFRHNWKTPLTERLTKRTAISQARAGKEQRGGARAKHRRQIEHAITTETDAARRRLEAFLFANQRKIVTAPVQSDKSRLAAPLSAGATIIPVSTEFMDYDAGGRVMLFNFSTGKGESAIIEEVAAEQLTLRTGLKNDWPVAGTRVAPAVRALLEARINVAAAKAAMTEQRIVANIIVEDVPASPNRFTPWAASYTYDALEVFDPFTWGRHDYSEAQQITSDQQRDDYDYETGVFGAESGTDAPQGSFTHRLFLKGRERISAFLGWWDARSGARAPLWVPTFKHDFKVVSMAGSVVTVADSDYLDRYYPHEARRDVAFILTNRTMAFRHINSAAPSGDTEALTMNSSVAALATTTKQLCFLKHCRLDADALELAWLTQDQVRVTLRFRELLTAP